MPLAHRSRERTRSQIIVQPALLPTRALAHNSGPSRLRVYNESLVNRLLDIMRASPVDYSAATPLVFSTAKEFAGIADKKEKWYGTPYQARNYTMIQFIH